MIVNRTDIRVRYADTDQMNFVYNGKYFEYFEVGRTEMMRQLELPYAVVEQEGYFLPVIDTAAKYIRPGRYDDLLTVESRLEEVPQMKMKLHYSVFRKGEENPLCTGHTSHVFIMKSSERPCRPPAFFLDTIKPFFEND